VDPTAASADGFAVAIVSGTVRRHWKSARRSSAGSPSGSAPTASWRSSRLHRRARDVVLRPDPLVVVAEAIEKPGNLGAIIRTADGAGADAIVAADPRTTSSSERDPGVPRTIFALPVVAASAAATIDWLAEHGIRLVAARVDASVVYTEWTCAVRPTTRSGTRSRQHLPLHRLPQHRRRDPRGGLTMRAGATAPPRPPSTPEPRRRPAMATDVQDVLGARVKRVEDRASSPARAAIWTTSS